MVSFFALIVLASALQGQAKLLTDSISKKDLPNSNNGDKIPRVDSTLTSPFRSTLYRIREHGYPAESHFVKTEDGYILNTFRMPYSPKLENKKTKRPAILLQHGMISNSDQFLINGPLNSLAFNLVDAGYDVWLANARGNLYSKNHTTMSPEDAKFWHFSWHEIGVYDSAALIDYITNLTAQSSIHIVGYSQGTTVYFVLLSERPEYNKKITSAHMLGTCTFLSHSQSRLFKIFSLIVGDPSSFTSSIMKNIEFFANDALITTLLAKTCGSYTYQPGFCKNLYLWVLGSSLENFNMTALQILLENHPCGISSNQLIHFVQLYASKRFCKFDFGEEKNIKKYKQPTPPDYVLENVRAPTYLYTAASDLMCVPEDVDLLVSKLKYIPEDGDIRLPDSKFNHLGFILDKNVKRILNDRLIRNCDMY